MKYVKIIFASLLFLVMALGIWSVFAPKDAWAPAALDSESKAEVTDEITNDNAVGATTTEEAVVPSAPTSAQAKALEAVGIDSTDLSFSAGEIACFKDVLGEERVAEIIAGAVPGPVELYKAKDCLGR